MEEFHVETTNWLKFQSCFLLWKIKQVIWIKAVVTFSHLIDVLVLNSNSCIIGQFLTVLYFYNVNVSPLLNVNAVIFVTNTCEHLNGSFTQRCCWWTFMQRNWIVWGYVLHILLLWKFVSLIVGQYPEDNLEGSGLKHWMLLS